MSFMYFKLERLILKEKGGDPESYKAICFILSKYVFAQSCHSVRKNTDQKQRKHWKKSNRLVGSQTISKYVFYYPSGVLCSVTTKIKPVICHKEGRFHLSSSSSYSPFTPASAFWFYESVRRETDTMAICSQAAGFHSNRLGTWILGGLFHARVLLLYNTDLSFQSIQNRPSKSVENH